MSDCVIHAEGLGKAYLIGHQGRRERYTALRDVLAKQARGMWSATRRALRGQMVVNGQETEEFWALRDVSFEVKQGEVVGIIGRNGAGKSTLLKILSRITEPTKGRVALRGRVASLLEVGTGFHPELTGRENIFLNGAILGMTRAEIKRKFDEIVAFAEVEKFLDTPVKRYSSGMYVRLAFAVAAHLEPEILVIDEVLAVGDAEFQKKCIGKMGQVASQGRTILFVSHNMSAVQSICGRAILLVHGRAESDGEPWTVVRNYLKSSTGTQSFTRPVKENAHVHVSEGRILQFDSTEADRMHFELAIWSDERRRVSLDVRLSDSSGGAVGFGSLGTFDREELICLEEGINNVRASFPLSNLANGSYTLSVDLTLPFHEYFDRLERCLSFDLERTAVRGRTHVSLQQWGYGSYELPLTLEIVDPSRSELHAIHS
jgi:lipopolysaccharide transport system ATP-binding protein